MRAMGSKELEEVFVGFDVCNIKRGGIRERLRLVFVQGLCLSHV